jgi:hypothetical protein
VSLYKQFRTDENLEKSGIKLTYGEVWFYVARAGGANKKFSRILEAKLKPHRRAVQTETMDEKTAEKLMREAYAEGVVLGWGSVKHGEGRMTGPDDEALDFTVENVVRVFTDLPDLFADLREQTGKVALFRATVDEADAGN